MGVLQHHRAPPAHLARLHRAPAATGQLILECPVIEGDSAITLVAKDRYAKMRNVWAIPTPKQVGRWASDAGYRNVRLLDLDRTTSAEQRRTPWMEFESLADFLDPDDASLTIEGYPAPMRALFTAKK